MPRIHNNPAAYSPLWHFMDALRWGRIDHFFVPDNNTAAKAYVYAKSWGFKILTQVITPQWAKEMPAWQKAEMKRLGSVIVVRDEVFDATR